MIENAIKYVKQIFAYDCSGHDYHYTMRVYKLAIQIAEQENADILISDLILEVVLFELEKYFYKKLIRSSTTCQEFIYKI